MSNLVQLSERASLALHAVAVLVADPTRPRSTGRIAAKLQASEAHLSKVLQQLARGGLVRSRPGPTGGFVLARAAENITLADVYEIMEGPLTPLVCLFDRPVCTRGRCMFGSSLREVDGRLRALLTDTTLADLGQVFAETKK